MVMAVMLIAGFSSCGGDDDDNANNDEITCWSCNDTGLCFWCDGAGLKDCRCTQFSYVGKCDLCKGSGRWYNDPCPTCGGSGICQYCYGSLKEVCEECAGSGICAVCGGGSNNGSSASGGSGGSGGSSSGSGGNNKRKCPICLGSGKCEAPNLGYIANKQYCWGNGKCRPCNGTGQQSNPFTGDYYACTYCNKEINKYYGDGICGKCGGSGKCHNCGGDGYK